MSAHATLAWVLDCVTPVGWLERMTQYKSKAEGVSASAGLFTCPALQAADILLYQAEYVPIGDDQRQHVELTRNIAQRFHYLFGPAFTLPQSLIRRSVMRAVTDSESEVDPEHISPGADSGAKRAASVIDQTLDQALRRTGLR